MGRFPRVFVIIAAISNAYGQTAQLSGVVRDPSQAVVTGASILVRNDGTLVERVTLTNNEGVYDVPFLLQEFTQLRCRHLDSARFNALA